MYFQPWPPWFVGTLGSMPEVKQEGEVFLEKSGTTYSPGPLKYLIADEVHFAPSLFFPDIFSISHFKKSSNVFITSNVSLRPMDLGAVAVQTEPVYPLYRHKNDCDDKATVSVTLPLSSS